jgi:hypothetical protein
MPSFTAGGNMRAVTDGEIMVCVKYTRLAPSTAARSTCRLGGR